MEIKITSNVIGLELSLSRFSEAMMPTIARTLDDQNLLTLGVVQEKHLNFPRSGPTRPHGLRHITGNLFSSPINSAARVIGDAVESSIGSPVVYARPQEEGFDGTQQVRGFTRKNPRRGRAGRRKAGRVTSSTSVVKPFSREMHIPARAPFGTALRGRTKNYLVALKTALEKVFSP